jgi:hypothetical protein
MEEHYDCETVGGELIRDFENDVFVNGCVRSNVAVS